MADFKLGRIKFKWRGNWATSTAYLIDDVIKYGGNTYVCTASHTSPANENLFYTSPGTYTNYWSLQAEALFFRFMLTVQINSDDTYAKKISLYNLSHIIINRFRYF